MDEDTSLPLTVSGTDVDDAVLAFEILAAPAHGTLAGTGPAFVYTPFANYFGTDRFTYLVRDPQGAVSVAAVISLEIHFVNDAPVAQLQSVLVVEDTSAEILLSASDVDGDPLSFSIFTAPAHGFFRFFNG